MAAGPAATQNRNSTWWFRNTGQLYLPSRLESGARVPHTHPTIWMHVWYQYRVPKSHKTRSLWGFMAMMLAEGALFCTTYLGYFCGYFSPWTRSCTLTRPEPDFFVGLVRFGFEISGIACLKPAWLLE